MKRPKLWDGPSPVGEALERALQKLDVPFLSTSDGQGTTVRKKIGYSEITIEKHAAEQETDGWLCIGYEGERGTSTFVVRGSYDGKSRFRKRGSVNIEMWEPTRGRYNPSRLLYYLGFGKASTFRGTPGEFLITSTGRRAKLVETPWMSNDSMGAVGAYRIALGRTTILGDELGPRWITCFVGSRLYNVDDAVMSYAVCFVTEKVGALAWPIEITLGAGWRHGNPNVTPVDAQTLLMVAPTYCVRPSDPSFEEQRNPRLSFMVRIDKTGVQQITPGAILDFAFPEATEIPSSSDSDFTFTSFNIQYISAPIGQIRFARLSDGSVLAINRAWYYDRDYVYNETAMAWEETPESTASRKKLAVFRGTEDGLFSRVGTISVAPGFGAILSVKYVGRFVVVRINGWLDEPWTYPPDGAGPSHIALFAVIEGGGLAYSIRTLPWPAHRCGDITVIDDRTLGITAYGEDEDGREGYYFWETKDSDEEPLGTTWRVRAEISRTAPPPPAYDKRPTDGVIDVARDVMENYFSVEFVRRGDRAAPVTPGALWMSNDSVQKPWE